MDRRLPKTPDETSSSDTGLSGDAALQAAEKRLEQFDAEAARAAFFSSLIATYRGDGPVEKFWQIAGNENAQQDYSLFQLVRDRHVQSLGPDSRQFLTTKDLVLTRSRLNANSWQTIGKFKSLTWLNLSFSNARADDLRWLKDMAALERLSLEGLEIDQRLLADICQLPALSELDLSMCNVRDEMLEPLKHCKQLDTLYLTGNPDISPATLNWLEKLPKMKTLSKP